jgi:hypothetical protein
MLAGVLTVSASERSESHHLTVGDSIMGRISASAVSVMTLGEGPWVLTCPDRGFSGQVSGAYSSIW